MFNSYYSAKHILSKKAIFNLVCSDRSDGKTFDMKLRTLADYYKRNEINVICRRYKSEMKKLFFSNFFEEVLNKEEIKGLDNVGLNKEDIDKIRKWKFRYSSSVAEVQKDNETWDVIAIFTPLTMSGKVKSMFNDYNHRIHCINVDEYVPLDNRYIADEPHLLLELWKSIDRDRMTTQLICLGNKITPFIPLLDYFNISLSLEKDKIRLYRNGAFAVQIYSNKEHREQRKEDIFAQLVKDTSYEEYSEGSILNALNINCKKREDHKYWASYKTELGEGTIWYKDGEMIITDYKRKDGFILVDKMYDTEREQYNIKFGRFGTVIKNAYFTNNLFFENEKSYHIFEPILKKC